MSVHSQQVLGKGWYVHEVLMNGRIKYRGLVGTSHRDRKYACIGVDKDQITRSTIVTSIVKGTFDYAQTLRALAGDRQMVKWLKQELAKRGRVA